ncbi:MAG: Uma2 family endonuclease [Chloroflexota bacterium]
MIGIEQETTAERLYTVDEFDDFRAQPENRNRLFELIDGEVFEKMPTEEHGMIALNVGSEFRTYGKQNKTGRAGVEVRHQARKDNKNSRLPDVSFRLTSDKPIKKGSVSGMPDLAVEIKSPTDTINGMRETAAYYLANGSRLVWLIYPEHRLVEVYRPNEDVEILNATQTLSGYDVMPGFEMPVVDVFTDPFAAEESE